VLNSTMRRTTEEVLWPPFRTPIRPMNYMGTAVHMDRPLDSNFDFNLWATALDCFGKRGPSWGDRLTKASLQFP
jgi:hypothetical protein